MNNVGVAGWRPLKPERVEVWLFFDQVLLRNFKAALSTFLFGTKVCGIGMDKPVDKSVTKLWKDPRRGRNDWPGAIVLIFHTAKGLHTPRPRSSKKLCESACSPCL